GCDFKMGEVRGDGNKRKTFTKSLICDGPTRGVDGGNYFCCFCGCSNSHKRSIEFIVYVGVVGELSPNGKAKVGRADVDAVHAWNLTDLLDIRQTLRRFNHDQAENGF